MVAHFIFIADFFFLFNVQPKSLYIPNIIYLYAICTKEYLHLRSQSHLRKNQIAFVSWLYSLPEIDPVRLEMCSQSAKGRLSL